MFCKSHICVNKLNIEITYQSVMFYVLRKQCWVCFGTPEDDEDVCEWISPCHCCGGTKWVHQTCLQLWIDEKQKMSSSVPVTCPQCQFAYLIKYPSSNPLLFLYDHIERTITVFSPLILAGITATSLYWTSFTYGVMATTLAMGREQALEFFHSPESTLAVVCFPIIPWVIVSVKIVRPEVIFLKCWYKYLLPLVARFLKGLPIVSLSTRKRHFQQADIQPLSYISRCFVSMALLPFISSALGHILFRFTTSGVKRTLLVRLGCMCVCVCVHDISIGWSSIFGYKLHYEGYPGISQGPSAINTFLSLM